MAACAITDDASVSDGMLAPIPSPAEEEALRRVALRRQRIATRLWLAAMACAVPILAIVVLGPSDGRVTPRPMHWSDWLLGAFTLAAILALLAAAVVTKTAPKISLVAHGSIHLGDDGFRHEPSPLLRAWTPMRSLRWDQVRGWAEAGGSGLPPHLLVFTRDPQELEPLHVAERDGAFLLRDELVRRDLPQVDLDAWERARDARATAAIERMLASDFPPGPRDEARAILDAPGRSERSARIDRALLIMARGDVDALRDYVGWAESDSRDVLFAAARIERGDDASYDLLRQHREVRVHADPLVRFHALENRGGASKRDRPRLGADGLVTGKGFVVVSASRPGEVDVRVEVRRRPPEDDAAWDVVRDTRLALTSFYLLVRGGSEPWKSAPRLVVKPATYLARVRQRVRDGRERIELTLWPE